MKDALLVMEENAVFSKHSDLVTGAVHNMPLTDYKTLLIANKIYSGKGVYEGIKRLEDQGFIKVTKGMVYRLDKDLVTDGVIDDR